MRSEKRAFVKDLSKAHVAIGTFLVTINMNHNPKRKTQGLVISQVIYFSSSKF